MKKIYPAIVFALCMLLLSACGGEPAVNGPERLLGASDTELTEVYGEGAAVDYEHEGRRYIIHRGYDMQVLGLDAYVEFMLSDDQTVSQLFATFKDADEQSVLRAMRKNLGGIDSLQKESEDMDFAAVRELGGVRYTARKIPDGGYYMMFEPLAE